MPPAESDLSTPSGATRAAPTSGSDDFFYTDAHWRALDQTVGALLDGRSVAALIGPDGSGKTTIARQAAEQLPGHVRAVFARADAAGIAPVRQRLAEALGAEDAAQGAASPSEALAVRLGQLAKADVGVAVFIDDADQLSDDGLIEAASLSELGRGDGGGLQVVLIGSLSMGQRLGASSDGRLRLAAQTAGRLRGLTRDEVANLLRSRCGDVGASVTVDGAVIDRVAMLTARSPARVDRLARQAAARRPSDAGMWVEDRLDWLTPDLIETAASALGYAAIADAEADADAAEPTDVDAAIDVEAIESCEASSTGLDPDFLSSEPPADAPDAHVRPTTPMAPDASGAASEGSVDAASPHLRRKRVGPRLVDPARVARRRRNMRRALGLALVVGVAVGTISVVDVATRSTPRLPSAPQLVGYAPTTQQILETPSGLRDRAEAAYEANRAPVLDAIDGALGAAEGAVRRAAAAAPGPLGDAASDLAARVSEERHILRSGRTIEALGQLPPQEADDARRAELARLFALAERRFAAEQFTRPYGASAYDAWLEAYRLAPESPSANAGFTRLAKVYRGLARSALEDSQYEEYYRLNDLADRIEARLPL